MSAPHSCGHILVVEDDPSVQAFIQRALEHAGHTVIAVRDGEIGQTLLETKTFDVLVTDLVLPGENNGMTLILKAVHLQKNIRIIAVSGHAKERQKASALHDTVFTVLPKPFSLAEIQEAVSMAVRDVRAEQAA